jgi:hypothetical protein
MKTYMNASVHRRNPAEAKVSASKIVALEIEMSKPRLNRVESRDGYNNP